MTTNLLPIISAVGPTGASKSATAVAFCQQLSTPLDFFEYQKEQGHGGSAAAASATVVAHTDIEHGQIITTANKNQQQHHFFSSTKTDSDSVNCFFVSVDDDEESEITFLVALKSVRQGERLVLDSRVQSLKSEKMESRVLSSLKQSLNALPPLSDDAPPFCAETPFARGSVVAIVFVPAAAAAAQTSGSNTLRNGTFRFEVIPDNDDSRLPNAFVSPCSPTLLQIVALSDIQPGEAVLVASESRRRSSSSDVAAHIINVDVMQTLPGLPIGTNKALSVRERGGIPHYLIGDAAVNGSWIRGAQQQQQQQDGGGGGIQKFVDTVTKLVAEIRERDRTLHNRRSLICLCGGTHYYQLALLVEGVSMMEQQQHDTNNNNNDDDDDDDDSASSPEDLWNKLNSLAPDVAQRFHPNDTRRVKRQIELALQKKKSNADEAQSSSSPPPTLRRFSSSSSSSAEPAPIVLWVHHGHDRDAFVRSLNARIEKMRQRGLLAEVLKHAVLVAAATTKTASPCASLSALLEFAGGMHLEQSVRGIESAIGFKEIVQPVLRAALEWTKSMNQQQHFESWEMLDHLRNSRTDAADLCAWADAVFPPNAEQLPQTATGALLREGLDRLGAATWRYAASQDQWLRRKFVPLHQKQKQQQQQAVATLPFFVCAVKSSTVAVEATAAIREALEASLAGNTSAQLRADVFNVLPELADGEHEDDAAGDNKKKLYRCEPCGKAMVGEEQWQAHCRTRAHQNALNKVEATPEQIARWKQEGDAKREERRRKRDDK